MPTTPQAISIFNPKDDKAAVMAKVAAFTEILNNPEFVNKQVFCIIVAKCLQVFVISIGGKYRHGKSFMLNFFLRFLEHLERGGSRNDTSWLTRNSPGFSCRAGRKAHTVGILVWSQPFILKVRLHLIFNNLISEFTWKRRCYSPC
jgi:hypothetical protein